MIQHQDEQYIEVYQSIEWTLVDYARCLSKVRDIDFVEPLMNGLFPYPPLIYGEEHPLSLAEIRKSNLEDALTVIEQCIKPTPRVEKIAKNKIQLDKYFLEIKQTPPFKDSWLAIIQNDLDKRLIALESYLDKDSITLMSLGVEFLSNLLSMRNSAEGLRIAVFRELGYTPYEERFRTIDRILRNNKPNEWILSSSSCEGELENLAPFERWWWFEDSYK